MSAGLQVEDEPGRAGTGDADHHAVARATFVLGEHGVAVVGQAVQDGGLAGAAGALGAGRQDPDPGFLDDVQDRAVRGTVRLTWLRASSTSKASARTGAVSGRALNRSTRSDRGGETRGASHRYWQGIP